MAKTAVLWILLALMAFQKSQAQANTSVNHPVYIDFGYGMPVYYGDLWKIGGGTVTFRGNPMQAQTQYNTSSVYAGALLPLSRRFYIRPQFSNSTVYFQEPFRNVYFRNNIFEAGLTAQFFVVKQRAAVYLFGGPSVTVSYDAELFNSQPESETTPQTDRVVRAGLLAGLGAHVRVWRQLHLFAEYQFSFTGTDRFDGYNGDIATGTAGAPDEKSYFNRDQVAVLRGGIRLPILRPPSRVEERPRNLPLSTVNPDPGFDEITLKQKEEAEKRNKPALYYKLGVKPKLERFTVAVSHSLTLEELERFNASAVRVAEKLGPKKNPPPVQLLEEPSGFTVHIGTFASPVEARKFAKRLSRYYRNVEVRKH